MNSYNEKEAMQIISVAHVYVRAASSEASCSSTLVSSSPATAELSQPAYLTTAILGQTMLDRIIYVCWTAQKLGITHLNAKKLLAIIELNVNIITLIMTQRSAQWH